MSTRRFDLIAFDWDGTLFDSTGLIARCIQEACRDLGVAVPSDADAAYVIGLGLTDALQHAAPGLPVERYPEMGRRYRHHYFARQHELLLFDGTLEMLQSLNRPARRRGRGGSCRWPGCSTARAPPTRRPPSRTRRCCSN